MSQVKIQTGLKLLNLTKNALGAVGSIVLSERFNYNLKLSELLYRYYLEKRNCHICNRSTNIIFVKIVKH